MKTLFVIAPGAQVGHQLYRPVSSGNSKKPTERICQSCWGSGFERDFGKQLDADQKNVKRTYPDLKAIEVTGEDAVRARHVSN